MPQHLIVALIVGCALLMETLDGTVIATALPDMAISLGSDPVRLSFGITAYMLSLAIFIPVSGWAADRYGGRTVFRAAIAVFTLGSILCGLCGNLPELAAARVIQGAGGAMMVPVGRLILLRTAGKADLVSAVAWMTLPAVIGPMIGPPLGGFMATYLTWRWIFFINIPIGLAGIALVTRFIGPLGEQRPGPLDLIGFITSGLALTGLMIGLELAGHPEIDARLTLALLISGSLIAAIALRHSLHRPAPLIDIRLFRIPTFAICVGAGSLFRLGVGAFPYLLPLLLQIGFGMTAFGSGLLTFASGSGALVMKLCARRVLSRWGFRPILVINGVGAAAYLSVCALLSPATPEAVILLVLLLGGFTQALQFTAINALTFADIPPARMSAATSLHSMIQQISLGMGVALAATILHASALVRGAAAGALIATDFRPAFWIIGVLSLIAAGIYLCLRPSAGADLGGPRPVARPVRRHA